MAEQQYKEVMLKNTFFRDNYRKIALILLGLICINIVLSGVVFYMVQNRPPPQYFATTPDGRLVPLSPLVQPMHSISSLLEWATDTAVSVYSYNFVNVDHNLKALSTRFTDAGYGALMQALTNTKLIETLKKQRLISQAVPIGAATLIAAATVNGVYKWKVSIPMLISYSRGGAATTSQRVVIRMLITRVSQEQDPTGIAVSDFTFSQAAS